MKHSPRWEMCCVVALLASAAGAQTPPPELEPGVQTSSSAAPAGSSLEAPPAAAPAPAADAAAKPAASAKPNSTAKAGAAPASAARGALADRVDLGTTTVSGNRELPKVMYVVPWRKPELGEFAGRPPNSLLDEALTPVDRDVFKRQNRYYAEVASQTGSAKSQPEAPAPAAAAPTAQGEK